MAKLDRVHQKLFGTGGSVDDFGQFGSLAAGAAVTTQDPATIQSLSEFSDGWGEAVLTEGSQPSVPALEDMNGLCLLIFYQICYLFQAGIPEYAAGTTYYIGSYCQVAGSIFKSLQDANIGHAPASSPTYWQPLLSTMPADYLTGAVLSNDVSDPTNALASSVTVCKDDSNLYTISANTLAKKVNSLWVAGNNNGGLDAGTIGASADLIYIFAIGKSTDPTAGDYLMSKSRTAPTMTRPNADGYDIKRLIGHRHWNGTSWDKFLTIGKDRTKTVQYLKQFSVLSGGVASSYADVDTSDYVDAAMSGLVNLNGLYQSNGEATSMRVRPKGATSDVYVYTTGGESSQTGTEGAFNCLCPTDTSGFVQYYISAIGGAVVGADINLNGFTEVL